MNANEITAAASSIAGCLWDDRDRTWSLADQILAVATTPGIGSDGDLTEADRAALRALAAAATQVGITDAIDRLRIAEDWGGGNTAIMLDTEAENEYEKQLAATADADNPGGWGEPPRRLQDDDAVIWSGNRLDRCCSHLVTAAAQPYVAAICDAAQALYDAEGWDDGPHVYVHHITEAAR